MPQTSGPVLRLCTQIQRHFAKGFFTRADGQEMMVEPRITMPVKHAASKLRAVAADEQMATGGVFHQRAHPCTIENNIGGFKPANGFLGEAAGMVFIADTDVASKAHALGCPGKQQDRRDRAAKLCKFDQSRVQCFYAFAFSISIKGRIGLTS